MSEKQAVNDNLQGSVATYLRCGRAMSCHSDTKYKGFIVEPVSEYFFKSVNIWQCDEHEFVTAVFVYLIQRPSSNRPTRYKLVTSHAVWSCTK